ncbi:unnamed protein product [Polarella glacialis]|uniref:Ataxin-10 domain-containing protein n=1 Tax=Polarella glacialis TaxID=89957 RepID=A0A813JUU8_POLGL|nr:unnamed protein product [Polarella glacialis]
MAAVEHDSVAGFRLAQLGIFVPEDPISRTDFGSTNHAAVYRSRARWWRRGLVERLAVQARADLAAPGGERGAAWCEAVPSFIANVLAGNPELRSEALDALFPSGLAAVLALCWRRPDLAFVLMQNLFAVPAGSCPGSNHPARKLVESAEGHFVLYLLLSLLWSVGADGDEAPRGGASEASSAKAREWASIFFFDLWAAGIFAPAYRGVQRMGAAQLHSFLCAVASVPGWGALRINDGSAAATASSASALESFGRLMGRLCSQREALGLLWHTVHGLLAGPEAAADAGGSSLGGGSQGSEAARLASALLCDSDFVDLAAEEMVASLAVLAGAWQLDWSPAPVTAEACAALGIDPVDLELLQLAPREDKDNCQLRQAETTTKAPAWGDSAAGGEAIEATKARAVADGNGFFRELLLTAIELAAIPRAAGSMLPPRLVGVYLSGNVSLIAALHHLRFGAAAVAVTGTKLPARQASASAVEAAKACNLVLQLRLCGNVLYDSDRARDFLLLSGGLPALLSHCYADPELPLLREAGVFAVRNLTKHSEEVRQAVRELLAERRSVASAAVADASQASEGDDDGQLTSRSAAQSLLPSIDESAIL